MARKKCMGPPSTAARLAGVARPAPGAPGAPPRSRVDERVEDEVPEAEVDDLLLAEARVVEAVGEVRHAAPVEARDAARERVLGREERARRRS